MKMHRFFSVFRTGHILVCAMALSLVPACFSQAVQPDFAVLRGPFLGQDPPGKNPLLFAPGFISTGMAELNSVFSMVGNEFYFCVRTFQASSLFRMKMKDGAWSAPELLPFASRFGDIDVSISPDGNRLFFCSKRPVIAPDSVKADHDIWVSRRSGDSWGEPQNLGPAVNSPREDFYPTTAANGSLYFNSQREGPGTNNIFVSRFIDGEYAPAVKLGPEINISTWNFDPYIDPDERFLVFASNKAGGSGGADLYVSFRRNDGSWSPSINLGNRINTSGSEFSPVICPGGKYLFFSGSGPVSALPARPMNHADYYELMFKPGNGMTDIYWVDAGEILTGEPR